MVKWPANYEPNPWNILFDVDSLHILAVGVTGHCQARRMTVIDAYNFIRIGKVSREQIFGGEFKVSRRIKGVAKWIRFFNMPVPRIVDAAYQQSACFNAL